MYAISLKQNRPYSSQERLNHYPQIGHYLTLPAPIIESSIPQMNLIHLKKYPAHSCTD